MDVRYEINQDHDLSNAHISAVDLEKGVYRMYLGGDIGEQTRIYREESHRVYKPLVERYQDAGRYIEDFCEGLINHEFIHLLIYDITESIRAVRRFDNIDANEEISAPGFWGSEL